MFLFLISYFGCVIKFRIVADTFARFNFSARTSNSILFSVLILDVIVIFTFYSPIFQWCCSVLTVALLLIAPKLLELHLERVLRRKILVFLDQILMSLQAGMSLRGAIQSIIDYEVGWEKIELTKAYSAMLLGAEKKHLRSQILTELFDELRLIDQKRAKTIEQIRSLRWRYEILENFRRKSGQVSQQTRIQSFVLTILYVALLLFSHRNFDLTKYIYLTVASVTLFLAGFALVFILGRKISWKI